MSRILHSPWLRALLLLVVAPLLLLVIRQALGHSWQTQGIHKAVDPFIYTSYIHDYQGLIEDFGHTYYGNRVAHILPSQWMESLIGGWTGYQAYRVVLWMLAYWSGWLLARQFRLSDFWCMISAGVMISHPWFTASVFWDHYDSTAVVLLLWMMTGLVYALQRAGRGQRTYCIYFLTGLVYLLVANSNSFLGGVGGIAWLVSFLLLFLVFRFRKAALAMASAIMGFIVGYALLVWVVNGLLLADESPMHYDLFSIGMSLNILGGGGVQWFQSITDYLYTNHGWHILLPLVLLLILLVVSIRRQFWRGAPYALQDTMLSWFVVLVLAGTVILYCWLNLVVKAAVITLNYYFIYILPASWMAALLLLRESQNTVGNSSYESGKKKEGIVIAAVICILLPAWTALTDYRILILIYLLLVVSAWGWCYWYGGLSRSNRSGALPMLGALLCLLSALLFNSMEYRAVTREYHPYVRDVWEASRFIGKEVRQNKIPGARFAFWYDNREKAWYAINSYYLWGYSRLQAMDDSGAGMPVFTERERTRIEDYEQLILLGYSMAEIEAGLQVLQREGWQWQTLASGFYPGQEKQYHYCLIRISR